MDVVYHWRDKILTLVIQNYFKVMDVAYFWHDFIGSLYRNRDKLLSLLASTLWTELLKFLTNPSGYLWAYIIGQLDDKLDEIFDLYW